MTIFKLGKKISLYGLGLVLFLMNSLCFAQTIIVQPNTVIYQPKTYSNVTLDMSQGSFVVINNATLTIENSTVQGTLSVDNPVLITVDGGNIKLSNNKVMVNASSLPQHPLTQSMQYVMKVGQGNVNLENNSFSVNQPFAAGLLITTEGVYTTGFSIVGNKFHHFHGAVYLINSNNAVVKDNVFLANSYGNLVLIGDNGQIIHNSITFSGHDHLGDSMDIIDSNNVLIKKNLLTNPTCHGIYILNSHDLQIDDNRIDGGITYAVNIESIPAALTASAIANNAYLQKIVANYKVNHIISDKITISNNYISQNRYGIAATDVDALTVQNNYFIQRFNQDSSRQFWTNNSILFNQVTNLNWTNNFYKEAYTQDINGDNSRSNQFVPFPSTGGVSL